MKIFLLKWKKSINRYNVNTAFVVVSRDELSARNLANKNILDEYQNSIDFWLNRKYTSCEEIKTTGKKRIILNSMVEG